jgi:Tol biopolymer transport system component
MNSDGTNNRQLTHDDLNLQLPQWAPDGQKIACNKAGTLYLVTLDGNVTTLSSGSIDRYNWSSDSKSIVYSKSIAGKRQIFKYDLIAQSETQLTSLQKNCLFPIFNPVNSKICFVTSSPGIELIIMESDGSNQKSLIQKAAITEPCYSPDGLHITFQVGNDNTSSTQNIAICDIDGSNYQIINKDQGNCSIPVWSNDGNYILYRRLAPLGI